MIQQSEYESIHILYDDLRKHYEYFGGKTKSETNWEMTGQGGKKLTSAQNKAKDVKGTTNWGTPRQATRVTETEMDKAGMKEKNTKKERKELTLEIQIGTLNISGIAYGYRGKYMKTEEELL
eukprot:2464370-Pleurochrysis_carterae.AAC.2